MENNKRIFLLKSCFALTSTLAAHAISVQRVVDASTKEEVPLPKKIALSLPMTLSNLDQLQGDPSQYFVSEKLDGVRAYWSGNELFFRSGRKIQCPIWFTQGFPAFPIDGELWMGRGKFEELSAAVRRNQADDTEWRRIKYCLFELPDSKSKVNFESRFRALRELSVGMQIPWLTVIDQIKFKSKSQIREYFQKLVKEGAEGIVLHRADADYEAKRSSQIYKYKPYFDAEALVLKQLPGTGKFAGLMGALLVEDREGKRFKLGSGFDDDLRAHPPSIGSWVTFRYRDLTESGIPRFATYLRQYEPD